MFITGTGTAQFHVFQLPACTAGCKVFTLPPSISGAPVSSETSLNEYIQVRHTLYGDIL